MSEIIISRGMTPFGYQTVFFSLVNFKPNTTVTRGIKKVGFLEYERNMSDTTLSGSTTANRTSGISDSMMEEAHDLQRSQSTHDYSYNICSLLQP